MDPCLRRNDIGAKWQAFFLTAALAPAVIGVVYSFIAWRKEQKS